jgi:hypothetical protein
MPFLGFLVRVTLASVTASAAAGMAAMFFLVAMSVEPPGLGAVLAGVILATVLTIFLGGGAAFPAVMYLTVPTIVLGGSLWLLGRRRSWLRRPLAAAIVGMPVGGITYALLIPHRAGEFLTPRMIELGWPFAVVAFMIAGACAGLVFRSSMLVFGTFIGGDVDEGEQLSDRGPHY